MLIDSTQKDFERHKGNAQSLFRGMLFGADAVLENRPRPICALNDEHGVVELLAVEKNSYLKFMKGSYDVNNPQSSERGGGGGGGIGGGGGRGGDASANAHIMEILDKPKQLRTSADIAMVSAYLTSTVPYFRQFKIDQMRELCRIVETVTFFDEKVLFQQGQRAEAFFAILSGHVEVFVLGGDILSEKTDHPTHGDLNLGKRVTTLVSGVTFGERSIETDDAVRLSSVVTGTGITELLVVPRDSYLALNAVLRNDGDMNKVTLLRQTEVFRALDAAHLNNFAKFLKPVTYSIGQRIYREGRTPNTNQGITVISTGECFVETDIQLERGDKDDPQLLSSRPVQRIPSFGINAAHAAAATSATAATRRNFVETLPLGRIGPGTMLYHFNVLSPVDDGGPVYHTETITATTPVQAYELSRLDFFHLNNDTRLLVTKEIAADRNATLAIDEDTWRKRAAWADFKRSFVSARHDTVDKGKRENIVDSYRALQDVRYTEHNSAALLQAPLAHSIILGTRSDGSRWLEGEFDFDVEYLRQSLQARGVVKMPPPPRTFDGVNSSGLLRLDIARTGSTSAHKGIQKNSLRSVSKKHNLAFVQQSEDAKAQRRPETSHDAQQHHQHQHQHQHHPRSALDRFRRPVGDAVPSMTLPFSLVHVHVERLSSSAGVSVSKHAGGPFSRQLAGLEKLGGRMERSMRCHLRLSGAMPTSTQARECAAAQVQQAIFECRSRALGDRTGAGTTALAHFASGKEPTLVWKQFAGFESMALQATEYFILYCRSAPLEYASFTPEEGLGMDFLRLPFPSSCKSSGQNYAVYTARSITALPPVKEEAGPSKKGPVAATAAAVVSAAAKPATAMGAEVGAPAAAAAPRSGEVSGLNGTVQFLVRNFAQGNRLHLPTPHAPVTGGMLLPDIAVPTSPGPDNGPGTGLRPTQRRKAKTDLSKSNREFSDDEMSDDEAPIGGALAKDSVATVSTAVGTAAGTAAGAGRDPGRAHLPTPLLLLELKSFGEILATRGLMNECVHFAAKSVSVPALTATYGLESTPERLYVCAAPLYEWRLLNESTLASSDIQRLMAVEKVPEFGGLSFGPTLAAPGKGKKPSTPSSGAAGRARPHAVQGDFAAGSPGKKAQLAVNDPWAARDAMIAIRREILLAHDNICAEEEDEVGRVKRRAETLAKGPPDSAGSGLALPLSPLRRPQSANRQQIKLLEALIQAAPVRTVSVDNAVK